MLQTKNARKLGGLTKFVNLVSEERTSRRHKKIFLTMGFCRFRQSSRLIQRTTVTSCRRLSATTTSQSLPDRFAALQERLPGVDFTTNKYELARHGRGESHHPVAAPDIVASPHTIDEIRIIVKHCVEHRIPIIPFGVGTSVEGHVSALHGGLCLDTRHLQSIEIPDFANATTADDDDVTIPDLIAVVGAGVTRKTLNDALRHTGMQFVVDPGADATIGGMVATGASGTTAVRYGTMRENILALDCILADDEATVVHAGTKALKNSAGYDLVSLMCGSEGTLGVITSITVKLHPVVEYCTAAVCVFDSLVDAAQAVASLKLAEIPVSRCELLDATSVQAFNAFNNKDISTKPMQVKPTLFLEFQGSSETSLQDQVGMTRQICVDDWQGSNFRFTSDEAERRALWSARHNLLYATTALRPGATSSFITDACVPLSEFANLIAATAAHVQELNVVGCCFGHAGDGNLHCLLPLLPDESEDYLQRVHQVNDLLIERTLAAGGTCTGEHGVGYGKIDTLEKQYGPGATAMMRMIKRGLDPYNIMNPGKVVRL